VSDTLAEALDAEYAATYAYGLIGSHLSSAQQPQARTDLDAHRQLRDELRAKLSASGVTPAPPAPAYQPTTPVTNARSAKALAVQVELALAGSWSDVTTQTDDAQRIWAIKNAQACTRRAMSWGASSQAFPGP